MDAERFAAHSLQPPGPTSPDAPAASAAIPTEAELVQRFHGRLRLFAARRLPDAAAAEDAAQETLRRVLEALRASRVEKLAALPAFVFETARHVCQQQARSMGREERALQRLHGDGPAQSSPDPLVALVGAERRAAVRRALEALGQADRDLLRACYYQGLEASEIAARLGITPAAVRVRKHRALRRMREILEERNL